jgi:hypothetical protein
MIDDLLIAVILVGSGLSIWTIVMSLSRRPRTIQGAGPSRAGDTGVAIRDSKSPRLTQTINVQCTNAEAQEISAARRPDRKGGELIRRSAGSIG